MLVVKQILYKSFIKMESSNDVVRERGWSIHSDQTDKSEHDHEELTDDQKKALLENFPQPSGDDHGGTDDEDMFRQDDDDNAVPVADEDSPPRKKSKITTGNDTITKTTATVAPELLEHAKTKLSKWAARLFDPDRIRGLVEAPQTIPLNDEFLKAFGQREKEFDQKLGRTIQIDRNEILGETDESDSQDVDSDNDDHDDMDNGNRRTKRRSTKKELTNTAGRKLKISNLAFTTTLEELTNLCHQYGPTTSINLLMDKGDRSQLNMGRAYVTFESDVDAQACLEHFKTCHGRTLRLAWADDKPTGSSTTDNTNSRKSLGGGGANRYWERDISTKCFRCQQIGHIAAKCPNPTKLIPCALCGNNTSNTTNNNYPHDMRDCSLARICFKCGLPGHVNRDCPQVRTIPKRVVCGICFGSGHHRVTCRRGPLLEHAADDIASYAKCMVCGQLGHFMCEDMKWFFGLDGLTCFNCGRSTHHGYKCDRPPLEQCARDEILGQREVERAAAMQL